MLEAVEPSTEMLKAVEPSTGMLEMPLGTYLPNHIRTATIARKTENARDRKSVV